MGTAETRSPSVEELPRISFVHCQRSGSLLSRGLRHCICQNRLGSTIRCTDQALFNSSGRKLFKYGPHAPLWRHNICLRNRTPSLLSASVRHIRAIRKGSACASRFLHNPPVISLCQGLQRVLIEPVFLSRHRSGVVADGGAGHVASVRSFHSTTNLPFQTDNIFFRAKKVRRTAGRRRTLRQLQSTAD